MGFKGLGIHLVKHAGIFLLINVFLCASSLRGATSGCELYPIAVPWSAVANISPGAVVNAFGNGTQPGSFGWLSWNGSASEPTLVASLTPPGNSDLFVDASGAAHPMRQGAWVRSKPGVSNSKKVRDALDRLKSQDIVVPVWDAARGQGANAEFRVRAFARIRLLDYQLPQQNRIDVRFLGFVGCGQHNVAPTVNAGPDQTLELSETASLAGVVTDDNLPINRIVSANWSKLSGPGNALFGNSGATHTTVRFDAPGLYVLELAASDSELIARDQIVITVNRPNRPPAAESLHVATDEDIPVNVLLTASDADGDDVSFSLIELPVRGTISGTPPNLVYAPPSDFYGFDHFVFSVNDGQLDSSNAVVNVTIRAVNDPPVADALVVTNVEDTVCEILLSGSDVEGSALKYGISANPQHGTLFGEAPRINYVPALNFHGTDQFQYRVNDGTNDSAVATVHIVVRPANDVPIVSAGSDVLLGWPTNTVELNGFVAYDDFPGWISEVEWRKISGPGTVTFTRGEHERIAATFSEPGVYVLRLWASDSFVSADDDLLVTLNAPPAVEVGRDVVNTLPAGVELCGAATDDGLPTGGWLVCEWTKVSGPGTVVFSNAGLTNAVASFSHEGLYVLALTAQDGMLESRRMLQVLVNRAPVVDAGSDRITTNLQVTLTGTVFDDGWPSGVISGRWEVISGPGNVLFDPVEGSGAGATIATFSETGTYILRFVGDDSLALSSDDVIVKVNAPPFVDAGQDRTATVGESIQLEGVVWDDGIGAELHARWSCVERPDAAEILNPHLPVTTVRFFETGKFVLQLAADDSLCTSTDEVTIRVLPVNAAPSIEPLPKQFVILPAAGILQAQVSDDSLPEGKHITVSWTQLSGSGVAHFSESHSPATAVHFSQPGDYVLRVTASDSELSVARDVVVAVRSAPANQAPIVDAGPDHVVGRTNRALLRAAVVDDGLPQNQLSIAWSILDGPGSVEFENPAATNTLATFSAAGTYRIKVSVDDSALTDSDEVLVTIYPENLPPSVDAGSDQVIIIPDPSLLSSGGILPRDVNSYLSMSLSQTPRWEPAIGQTGMTEGAMGHSFALVERNGLDVANGVAYVAGSFRTAGGIAAKGMARWDGQGWRNFFDTNAIPNTCGHSAGCTGGMVGWVVPDCASEFCTEFVSCIAARGNEAFIGGYLKDLGNLDGQMDMTARWDGERWWSWVFKQAGNHVRVIRTTPDRVYVGGHFAFQPTNATSQTISNFSWSYHIAAWDGTNWIAFGSGITDIRDTPGSFAPGLNNYRATVTSLAVAANGDLYVAGDFLMATATGIATNAAKWNGQSWERLGNGLRNVAGLRPITTASAVAENGDYFVGGTFDHAGGVAARNVARWDGSRWWSLGDATTNGVNQAVEAIAVRGHEIYVGGSFTEAGGIPASRVAMWNGQYWSTLGTGESNGVDGEVRALASDESGVYVGGRFTRAGPFSVNNIARWAFPRTPADRITLRGRVTDDGLPDSETLAVSWKTTAGPGSALISNADSAVTTAGFTNAGNYVLQLTGSDGEFDVHDEMSVLVRVNTPPRVDAGPDKAIGLDEPVAIVGSVEDDSLPERAALFHTWTVLHGPGQVTFDRREDTNTVARFSLPGIYVLRLHANDSQFTAFDDVRVIVKGRNRAPDIYPGPPAIVMLGSARKMTAEVTDDKAPSGVLTCMWNLVSGPAPVTFSDTSATNTFVSFPTNGIYVLGITANDSELSSSATVTITVVQSENANPVVDAGPNRTITNLFMRLQGAVSDDGRPWNGALRVYWESQPNSSGVVTFSDSNSPSSMVTFSRTGEYNLVLRAFDGQAQGVDTVSIMIPNQSAIVNAGPDRCLLWPSNEVRLAGQVVDNSLFTASWSHVSGPGYVEFSSWSSLNATARFSTSGTHTLRLTVADNGKLISDDVVIRLVTGTNGPPQVFAGPDVSVGGLEDPLTLTGVVEDDGCPQPPGLSGRWERVSGPAGVTFNPEEFFQTNTAETEVVFPVAGTYTLRLHGSDSLLTNADDITVTVIPPANAPPSISLIPDRVARVTNILALEAHIIDDSMPVAGQLNARWRKVSGPGSVTWSAPTHASSPALELQAFTTASFNLPGIYVLQFSVDDSVFKASREFTVTVLPSDDNSAPSVNAGLDATAVAYRPLNLNGIVVDDGLPAGAGVSVNWSVVSGPAPVYFSDANTLEPYAQFLVPGMYVLRLMASDSRMSAQDTLSVSVRLPENNAPLVFAGLHQEITRPHSALLHGVVVDDDLPLGYPLATAWSVAKGPGSVRFDPHPNDPAASASFTAPGEYVLRLTASDSQFSVFSETTVLVREGENTPPSVSAGPDSLAVLNEPWALEGCVEDDGLPGGGLQVSWRMASGPAAVYFSTLDGTYHATFVEPGTYDLELAANDGALSNFDRVRIVARHVPPPVARIDSPRDGTVITAPMQILGTAHSAEMAWYRAELRMKSPEDSAENTASWTVIGQGTSSVVNGELARLDPTLLLNGLYEVRLTATDRLGRVVETDAITIIMDRNLKLGHFTVSFADLVTPVPGLPLQVTRTYDTRAAAAGIRGDFGIGWTMDIRNVRLQKNRSLSRNWTQAASGDPFQLTTSYHLDSVTPRLVTITFPDGRVEKFQLLPDPMQQQLIPISYPRWRFVPLGNTRGSLVPASYDEADGSFLFFAGEIPGTADLYDLNYFYAALDDSSISQADLERYPTLFRYTSPEGFRYVIDERLGLQSVSDLNGNALVVGTNGITWQNAAASTNALRIAFERDALGQITNIVDAAGNAMSYRYDTNSNLVGFSDRDGGTNAFGYDAGHRLISITDARGLVVMANTYDGLGRLVSTTDADGGSTTFSHRLDDRIQCVTNRVGAVTLQEFDEHGNVIRTTDPLGALSTFEYDANGNLLSRSNGVDCACAVRYAYDSADNRVLEIDAAGNTTAYTYNSLRKILTAREPTGFTTTNTYDAGGNLLATRDGAGQVTVFTYNALGRVVSMTDSKGTTSFGYDDFGFLIAQTNGLGHVTEFTVDANGNLLSESAAITRITGLAARDSFRRGGLIAGASVAPEPVTNLHRLAMRYEYTPGGLPLRTLYYDGSSSSKGYEAGRVVSSTDQLGRTTSSEYNSAGLLSRRVHPGGAEERFNYDAEGQLIESVDKRGFTTRFGYDLRGNLVRTVFSDGSEVRASFYSDGALESETSKSGEVTRYELDSNRNRIRVIDAFGITHFKYNYRGHVISTTDPLNRTNGYEYDSLARNTAHIYPDGARKSATFSGKRVASETDQNGNVTHFTYDQIGNLVAVVDALGAVTRFTYDEQGNKTSQTDALGRTTYFEYDAMRRLIRTIHPDASTEGRCYDPAGRLLIETNQLGDIRSYEYDAADNVVASTDPLGQVTRYTYDAGGNKLSQVDPNASVTSYEYDSLARLTRTLFSCGTAESNSYDVAGNLVSTVDQGGRTTRFEHDLKGRVTRIIDPLGNEHGIQYDAVGNQIAEVDAAGQKTVREFDGLNRLVATRFPDGTSIRRSYDGIGRVTLEVDPMGSVQRFGYDAIGRLIATTNAAGAVKRRVYDRVGSLIEEIDAAGNRTRYEHDIMGRVTRIQLPDGSIETTHYDKAGYPVTTTDALGNTTIHEFDAAGRPTAVVNPLGSRTRFTYDPMGRLASTTDAEEHTSIFNYDCMGRMIGMTHPDGTGTSAVFDSAGRRVIDRDANGNVTRYAYDERDRLLSRTDALNGTTHFAYDSIDRLIAQTDALNRTTHFQYDMLGRLVRTVFPDGASTSSTFDAKGRRISRTDPRGNVTTFDYDNLDRLLAETDALGHATHYSYDSLGRIASVTDPNGHQTTYNYDDRGHLLSETLPDGYSWQFEYDASGRRVAQIDPAGQATRYTFDAAGRLAAITNALGLGATLQYDAHGRLTTRVDAAGRATRFEYDSRGRRTLRVLPGGQAESLAYDPNGNLTFRTNFNGRVIQFTYDALDRLTAKIPDAELQASGSVPVLFTYNPVGRRTSMTDSSGVTLYSYDLRDRLAAKVSPEGSIGYSRDANGNLLSIQSSNINGVLLTYEHDAVNRLKTVDDGRLGPLHYEHDPAGNLTAVIQPNGVTQHYRRDAVDRLLQVTATNRFGENISRHQYSLGLAGHRLAVRETFAMGEHLEISTARTNTYDAIYRLKREQVERDGQSATLEYDYDFVGNRLAQRSTFPGISSDASVYDLNDWLASDEYDSNGNTLAASIADAGTGLPGSVEDTYDFEDRLVQRQGTISNQPATIIITYNGDGHRVRKVVMSSAGALTNLFLVDDQNPTGYAQVLEEAVATPEFPIPTVTRVYSVGKTRISQEQVSAGEWTASYFGTDAQGSVRYLTGRDGEITDTWDYDAFGNVIRRKGPTANLFLFGGEQFDPELQLYYLRARYADPRRGRFWTADTFEGFESEPASWHRYAFNQNDPVNRSDPSGHISLGENLMVSALAPMVRGMVLQVFDGANHYSHGLAGGSALKATSRAEAYMIDSLARGAGWQSGKEEFWATVRGAPFLLAQNPNVVTAAKPCSYECITFDLDAPVYGPAARHPMFELQPGELLGELTDVRNGSLLAATLRAVAASYAAAGEDSTSTGMNFLQNMQASLVGIAANAATPQSYVDGYRELNNRAHSVMLREFDSGSGDAWAGAQGLSSLVGDLIGYNGALEGGFGIDRHELQMLDSSDRWSRGFAALSQAASTLAGGLKGYNPEGLGVRLATPNTPKPPRWITPVDACSRNIAEKPPWRPRVKAWSAIQTDGIRGYSRNAPLFYSIPNSNNGRIWVSVEVVSQLDFAPLVEAGVLKGNVTLLTGTHGDKFGNLIAERAFFDEDLLQWRDRVDKVKVIDVTRLSPRQLRIVLSRDGRIICAWCVSERSKDLRKAMRN